MNIKDISPAAYIYQQRPICGIYFLLRDGEIVYVGQSINIHSRVSVHYAEARKDFDSYAFIECHPNELCEREQHFILRCDPEYNSVTPNSGGMISTNWIKSRVVGSGIAGGFGPSKIQKTLIKLGLKPILSRGRIMWNRAEFEMVRGNFTNLKREASL